MNLVNCPNCGAQILAGAGVARCPKCAQSVRVVDSGEAERYSEPPTFSFPPGADPPGQYRPATSRRSGPASSPFAETSSSAWATTEGVNPYQSPNYETQATWQDAPPRSGLLWILFSFQGRIPRRVFWAGEIGVRLASYAVLIPFAALLDGQQAEDAVNFVSLLIAIPTIWMSLAIAVKRWHDLDKSGWWVLIGLVPCVGPIWAFIETGCLRGTIGPNQYGPDPT